MTRYALIDPLLKELGWDLSDPGVVVHEDKMSTGSKTDYTMEQNAMIVEAMKLDENLDKWADKLISYVQERGVRYGVLTNGQKWRMYDSQTTQKSPQMEFDITDSDGVVISKAIQLHRSVVLDGVPRKSGVDIITQPKGSEMQISDRLGSEVTLPDIKYTKGMAHPRELVCPGKNIPLGSWVDLFVGVTNWLVTKKHLDESHCPVLSGPKNYILNTRAVHQNGKKFRHKRKVGRFYLNTNVDPETIRRHAIKLIETAGLEPSAFKVYFDPNHPDPWPKNRL